MALHKMVYKCEHCDYSTKRVGDLRRHQNKKFRCYNKSKVSVDNVEEGENRQSDTSNLHCKRTDARSDVSNLHYDVSNLHSDINSVGTNTIDNNINKDLICSKCFKTFSRKSIKLKHESKCDGLDSRQCKICLKLFATSQSKWNHNNNVKCSPPPIQQPHTVKNIINNNNNSNNNNITNNNSNNNNITNNNSNNHNNIDISTTNIQNNNNIQLTLNFGNEDLSGLINEPNYMRNVERQIQSFISQLPYLNEDAGKIIIAEIMKKIYFNKDYPQNQTIKKTCKKDKMVKIFDHNQWKNRVIHDVFKRMSGKMQEYFFPYFETLCEKYDGKTKNDLTGDDKYIITNTRGFGHRMVWFDWDDIMDPIIQINDVLQKTLQLPDTNESADEHKQQKIIKNTINFMSQEMYDNTKQIV